ncbi:MAG TPA: hypothetical protein VN877_07965 [Opitutaceae bacterium]|nr:hypothetical protein [Opitutaceae bacterium]
MSLNRCEQTIFDYMRGHPDERQYLHDKVRGYVAGSADASTAVARIDSELWRYYEERSAVVRSFNDALGSASPRRTSMKNLAELLVRLWTDPKPRKTLPDEPI